MRYAKDFYLKANSIWELQRFKPSTSFIKEGVIPLIPQTPGRHLFYTVDNEPHIPHEIRFKIRMPVKWAQSEFSKKYLPDVEQNVLTFLKEAYGYNTLNPSRGFDLEMTVGEAVWIQESINHLKSQADQSTVQKILEDFKSAEEALHTARHNAINKLGEIYDATVEEEK